MKLFLKTTGLNQIRNTKINEFKCSLSSLGKRPGLGGRRLRFQS